MEITVRPRIAGSAECVIGPLTNLMVATSKERGDWPSKGDAAAKAKKIKAFDNISPARLDSEGRPTDSQTNSANGRAPGIGSRARIEVAADEGSRKIPC